MMLGRVLHLSRGLCVTALSFAAAALVPDQARAANLVPLVSFNGTDGSQPVAGLIADANGNLFGTTLPGGAHGGMVGVTVFGGTVFEIAKTASGYASTPIILCDGPGCLDRFRGGIS